MVDRRRCARLAVMVATLATLVLLATLAGCNLPWQQGQQAPQPDLAKDQTLKLVMSLLNAQLGLATLDPAQAQTFDPATLQAESLLYDTLVTVDRKGAIEPWGAAWWTVSPDGLTYTFTLRPHQRFSDGAPVTASDYAWSLDRMANPCVTADNLDADYFAVTFLAVLKDAPAFHGEGCANGRPTGARTSLVGDALLADDSGQTLTILLAQPSGAFLAMLATPLAAVLERSVVRGADLGKDGAWAQHLTDGATGRGGSGMFYLASTASGAYEAGASVVLNKLVFKPNPYWWGITAGKKPHFSEVQFLSGDLDTFLIDDSVAFANRVYFQTLQRNPDVRRQPYYHEQPLNTTYALEFNWKKAPFDDLNARKAFCLAINREPFNQQVYPGVSIPGWHIIPQGMAGYNPALKGLDGAPVAGDAALAKQYWQAYLAAHGGQAPQIGVTVSDAITLTALAQDWRRVLGVSVSVWVPDMIVTPPRVYQPLSIAADGWAYDDPQDAFPPDFASLPGESLFGINVPAASALMRQAGALSEMSQRIPLYQQAERLFIDNGALCPLYQSVSAYALRTWVKGDFVEDGRGVFPNDAWVTGYIARH